MSEALQAGISRYSFYSLRDKGVIKQISRGVYSLSDLPALSSIDLAIIGLRFPKSVICLVSALAFHEMTRQIPHEVSIAVLRATNIPSIAFPPIQVYSFSAAAFLAGVETHKIDGIKIQVYSPEKTLADCFKFRNKLGMDIVLEALKIYISNKSLNVHELMRYARVCRVEKIITPYVEAFL